MKFFSIIVLLSFLVSNNTGIEVTYQQKRKKSHILNSTLPAKIKQQQLKDAKKATKYTLQILGDSSYFYGQSSSTVFFKNHQVKKSYMVLKKEVQQKTPDAVMWNHKDFNWIKSFNETKEILGYQCFKAVTSDSNFRYTAWYCPDLEVADGPYRFAGLDGLILEIETKVLTITAISVERKDNMNFSMPKQFNAISLNEFRNKFLSR